MKLKITEEQFKIVINFLNEEIIDGSGGDPWKYKKEGDTYFAAKKGTDSWKETSGGARNAIKSKIFKGVVTDKEEDEDKKNRKDRKDRKDKRDEKKDKRDEKKDEKIVKRDEKIVSNKKPGKTISRGDAWGMNTHVGIVGAIKNGTPIIFHNIHGSVYADPKGLIHDGGRVVWVRRSSDAGIPIGDGVRIYSKTSPSFYTSVLSNIKKISSSKSVLMFNISEEQCAKFVNDFENSSRTGAGGVGDAWLAHNNRSLGSLSYTAFEGLSSSDSNSIINLWQKIHNNGGGKKNGTYKSEAKSLASKLASKSSPSNLQLGDIVGIYYPPSSYHEMAFYNGGKVYFT
jgi:hypothetical protein